MIDYGTRQTDLAVKRAEWRLSRVYHQAAKDIEENLKAWQKGHAARESAYRQQLAEGKITQADFDAWMRGQVFQGEQWKARQQQIQQVLLNADKTAANIVNQGKLGVFAENANYIGYSLEHGANIKSGFMLYDEQTVARLIKSDPQILPKAAPSVKKDKAYAYYNKLMNGAITQGIVQGEDIGQIAKRIARTTGERSYTSAVRNARTAFTGAQNAGRIEGLHQAQELGIKVKKQWMATLDNRTRDTHADLDGQIRDVDEPFEVDGMEIDYPGDPTADPSLVYNCRCTLVYVYPEYPNDMQRRDNETGENVGDMTYKQWQAEKQAPTYEQWQEEKPESTFATDKTSRGYMREIIDTFGIENPTLTKRDITDFYQYVQQTNGITQTRDAKGYMQDNLTKKAQTALDGLIDKLTDRMHVDDPQAQQQYSELYKLLKQTPLYISKYDRADIPDFWSYAQSKENFVRTSLKPGALSLDAFYDELIQSYPGTFPEDVYTVSDKLQAINDAMSNLQSTRSQSVKDVMPRKEFEDMRDDLSCFLLAGYDAIKEGV